MFFSVIIPLYNKEDFIVSALESVLCQDFQDFEVIVVNDGSTDDSFEKVTEIKDVRLRIISTPNRGPASARNTGIQNAQGSWIIFLDADDTLVPQAFSLFLTAIKNHSGYDVYYGTTLFYQQGIYQSIFPKEPKEGFILNPPKEAFFRRLSTAAGSSCFKKSIFSTILYNPSYFRGEDVDLHFRIWKQHHCYQFNEPTVIVNVDTRQASKPRANIKEDYTTQICLKHANFWERMYLFELHLGAKNTYHNLLPNQYDRRYLLLFLNRLLLKKW